MCVSVGVFRAEPAPLSSAALLLMSSPVFEEGLGREGAAVRMLGYIGKGGDGGGYAWEYEGIYICMCLHI